MAEEAYEAGVRVVRAEAAALEALAQALSGPLRAPFNTAVAVMAQAQGRVIVSGMGKSGHIARKIAATLASTGQPALFVHPAEASHGDLGMIAAGDVLLAISRSGETRELGDALYHCRRWRIPVIGLTFRADSTLAQASDVLLLAPECGEASEAAPAPTSSTTLSLALGDALAVALLERRGFTLESFRAIHPGGALGAALLKVGDVMRTGAQMPLVCADAPVPEAIAVMTAQGLGCTGVVQAETLLGVITDGDLRRKLTPAAFGGRARDLMTPQPHTITPGASLADALALMHAHRIAVLFAVEEGRPLGVVHLQQLLEAGVR
jgi:arabinose-5-phosphate isomerase